MHALNNICWENSKGKKGFILGEENAIVIELMCQYLNNEPEFENNGFDLNKGIFLYGAYGSGKTIIMKAYREVKKKLIKKTVGFKKCTEINQMFLKIDPFTDEKQSYLFIQNYTDLKLISAKQTNEMIFDDIGEEETTVIDFGNRVCLMAHILSERYNLTRDNVLTHLTTNHTKKQIEDKYGGRIASRTFEMFNMINLGSKVDSVDYRKI